MVQKITKEQIRTLLGARDRVNIVTNDPLILAQARFSKIPNTYSVKKFIHTIVDPDKMKDLVIVIPKTIKTGKDLTIHNTLLSKGFKHIVEYEGNLWLRKSLPFPKAQHKKKQGEQGVQHEQ